MPRIWIDPRGLEDAIGESPGRGKRERNPRERERGMREMNERKRRTGASPEI
jgi:hypothetical protein